MTSIASFPFHNSNISGPPSIVGPDGIQIIYIDENPVEFKDETLKTQRAFALRIASKNTANISKIIESGRLAVLKIKNNSIQSVIICPYLKQLGDISKLILFMPNNKGIEGATLLSDTIPLKKLPEKDYVKLSGKLGFNVKYVTG
jgi:hypothetical protein